MNKQDGQKRPKTINPAGRINTVTYCSQSVKQSVNQQTDSHKKYRSFDLSVLNEPHMLPLCIFSANVTTVYMFVADKFVVEGDSERVSRKK